MNERCEHENCNLILRFRAVQHICDLRTVDARATFGYYTRYRIYAYSYHT